MLVLVVFVHTSNKRRSSVQERIKFDTYSGCLHVEIRHPEYPLESTTSLNSEVENQGYTPNNTDSEIQWSGGSIEVPFKVVFTTENLSYKEQ